MMIEGREIKGICVLAHPRTGSTHLCEQLKFGMKGRHRKDTILLYEILSPHNWLFDHTTNEHIEISGFDDIWRPFEPLRPPIDVDRLESIPRMIDSGKFPLFKIFPSKDIREYNHEHVRKHIYDNDSIYKICLTRADVTNQLLSQFIASDTGVFFHDSAIPHVRLPKDFVSKSTFNTDRAGELARELKTFWLWYFENAYTRCDKTVWYDRINETTYPDLGLDLPDLQGSRMTKMIDDHVGLAKKRFDNFYDLYKIASGVEESVRHLRDYMRRKDGL